MLDAAPGQIGDVQQAVDATEVDERAVVGDVLDDALDHRAFLQGLEELLALFTLVGLDDGATRHDHVVALAVELDDLELELLALVGRGVLDRTGVDQRARQERTDAVDHDGETALHLAGDETLHQRAGFERLLQLRPGGEALGLVAGQAGLAVAVFQGFDGNRHEIAGLRLNLATIVAELLDGNEALGLESRVDNDVVRIHAYDFGRDDLSCAHFLARQTFLEEGGEVFDGGCGRLG